MQNSSTLEDIMIEIILKLIDSNLFAVLIGGTISLVSVYMIELLRSSKEKKLRKFKVFQDINANTKLTYRYIILDTQMDIFHAYHKRMKELTKEKYHEDEAQRRLIQLEEFKLKQLSLEAEFNKAIASFNTAFGIDANFNKHVKRFDEWDIPANYEVV
jgi:hypothetical protein